MLRTIAILATLVVAGVPAYADVAGELATIEARQKACIDKDSTNLAMKQCAGDADADADTLLNKTYAAAVANLKGAKDGEDAKEKLRRLVASERAWIAYRDAQCDFEGTSMLGGTGESLVIVDCQYTMTAARAKAIGSMLDAN